MSETTQRIAQDKQVTMHFTLALTDGSVVDTTRDKEPAIFIVGDGNLLPGFEKPLMGLKKGDRRSVVIEFDNGFGPHRDENVQKIKRRDFDESIPLENGVVVSFKDQSGSELPGVIESFDNDYVTVDFNHPLAGKDIHFEVEIIDVDDPVQTVKLA